MNSAIRDGTGGGYSAKVDSNNRVHTKSVTDESSLAAIFDGNGYNINTGIITLTNDTDTPVVYVKNNEDFGLVITAVAIGLNYSTGGSATDMAQITFVRNPTAGTIVSGATAVDINSNRNYGSNNVLDVNAYKGATGNTMTDGQDHILVFANDGGRSFITIAEDLPKGATFGIKVQAPSGNTSMEVYAALICHLEK